jgi:predicted Zn-dependent protease
VGSVKAEAGASDALCFDLIISGSTRPFPPATQHPNATHTHTHTHTHTQTPMQLQAVVAHELGHVKCEHGVWLAAANALALGLYSLGGGLGRMLGDRIQGARACLFECLSMRGRNCMFDRCVTARLWTQPPPSPPFSLPTTGLLLAWLRAAEFSCDRAALLVAQVCVCCMYVRPT